jgi:CBS domain-containing protein
MTAGELCTREVVIAHRDEPLSTIAHLMCDRHVGTVIVVKDEGARRMPVGVITDRDVLRVQMTQSADLNCLSTGDALTPEPLLIREDADVSTVIERLTSRRVRRAPVVDEAGGLVGVISVDDVIPYLAEELSRIARIVSRQSALEQEW